MEFNRADLLREPFWTIEAAALYEDGVAQRSGGGSAAEGGRAASRFPDPGERRRGGGAREPGGTHWCHRPTAAQRHQQTIRGSVLRRAGLSRRHIPKWRLVTIISHHDLGRIFEKRFRPRPRSDDGRR